MFSALFVHGSRSEPIELALSNHIKLPPNTCRDSVGLCRDSTGFRNKMAVFDVGPVLEVVTSLQGKLEEAVTKSKLLLEAIEGSQSKYTELNSEYPVLRCLKGRLSATQGPNESLSTELVKFKVELEYFVEDIFNAHEKVRQDFQLWAKELERYDEKSRREKVEFIKDREKFYSERVKYFDTVRLATKGKTKRKENSDDNEKSEAKLFVQDIEEDNNDEIQMDSKSTLGKF